MASSFRCRVITPAGKLLDETATYASLPAWDGLIGVLPGRAPMVTSLGVGELRVDFADTSAGKGGSRSFVLESGFAQMVQDRLTILSSKATPAESLSEADAQAELAAADAKQLDESTPPAEADRIRKDRERARTKLSLVRTLKSRGI
ncbi:MAG: F0F1 ATP synthase subunit epsilon [Phycisphaerae bacterium]|nr:F0F1 ATP synthase subunit epsilon [Phycisphaerae bacterium]